MAGFRRDHSRWLIRAWRYRLSTEIPEVRFLFRHLKANQVAIDIGAHKGAYTYWMSKRVGVTGHVIAFEPQPQLSQALSLLAVRAKRTNITVESLALSSTERDVILFVPGDKPSPSATITHQLSHSGKQLTVRATTLDKYVLEHQLPSVDFIKCDAEGHELDVMQGARSVLERYQPPVLVECEARHNGPENVDAVFEYFRELNYVGCFYDGKSYSSLDNFDLSRYQADPDGKLYVNNFFFTPGSSNT